MALWLSSEYVCNSGTRPRPSTAAAELLLLDPLRSSLVLIFWKKTTRRPVVEAEFQKLKKVNSNENRNIYLFFERLGHQNSADFPIKNHQESCLQSKPTFGHLKSHKIWESDPKVSPMRDPKSIKNQQKSTFGHPRAFLSAPLHQMTAKVMPKWSLRTPKCSKNGLPRPLKINKCVCNPAWN